MPNLRFSSDFDLASVMRAGDHVAWPQGTGEPTGLTAALGGQAETLDPFTLVLGMVTTGSLAAFEHPNVSYLCLNGAAQTRKAAALSNNRIVPAHVSAIPGLIASRRLPVDVALIRVRQTDDPHKLSLGVMVDFVHEMIAAARVVIAEIDERMPLTAGDALVDRDLVDHFTLADRDEPLFPDPCPPETDIALARRVAGLIPDRATVQVGVGGLPVAVCDALSGHKDLGLHSGVVPDAVVDLIERGVVTNRYKGIDDGVSVTGGLFGGRKLNDFADGNDAIALKRATHTHAARTLIQLRRLYSINSAVEIDLSGQVNSEIAGTRYVGAVGGQIDFVRGGRLSEGGRSIIALSSVTANGKHSKIVSTLGGRPVTTARSDLDLVATENGVAELWGLDLHARARALIAIAHPDFQESLERSFHSAIRETS